MTLLQSFILGLVQGLTEFLPVSSSGHLVLVEHLLKVPTSTDITFEVFVHFGTLVSVLLVFWNDVVLITRSVLQGIFSPSSMRELYRTSEHFRFGILILFASIPAAYVGLTFEDRLSHAFADPKLVAVMLILTGLVLFLTRLKRPVKEPEGKKIGWVKALLIGIAQSVAIIPGISRSGSTISAAIYLGVTPVQAARFSFLLSLPAVGGATLLKTKEMIEIGVVPDGILQLLVGTLVAFASGYLAIKFLLKVLERGRLSWFAFYCLAAGVLGILFI